MPEQSLPTLLRGILRAKMGTRKNINKLMAQYRTQLPSSTMGEGNYNEAMRKVRSFLNEGNFKGAREYIASQRAKIKEQNKGTGSEGYIK